MRRTALLLTAAFAAVVLLVSPAGAQTNPYSGTTTGLSSATPNPAPGATVTITGAGCAAGETVRILVAGTQVGTVTAGADGSFSAAITAPTTPGPVLVNAVCGTDVLGILLQVAAPAPAPAPGATPGAGRLPTTGSDSLPLVKIGAVLLASGAFAVLAVRRNQPLRARAIR